MADTLLALLSAFLISEFACQSLSEKEQPLLTVLCQPVANACLATLFVGQWHLPIVLTTLFMSLTASIACRLGSERNFWSFAIREGVQLVVIAALAIAFFPTAVAGGIWPSTIARDWWNVTCRVLAVVAGLIVCVPTGGKMIGLAMRPFTDQIDKRKLDGLTNGGRYIGWLERLLIAIFVLMGSMEGVGFLLGAKSILRFGEIKGQEDRKVTEYIIIGTFFSFGWGILVAELTRRSLENWIP